MMWLVPGAPGKSCKRVCNGQRRMGEMGQILLDEGNNNTKREAEKPGSVQVPCTDRA